ncbi:MAG: TonB-dependent receptor, partial [Neisseria sp.]|nr:TonB-dependent receptor [Neisseria sp.]
MDNKLQTANSGILRAAVLAALALAALPAQADEAVQDSPEAEHTQALQEVKVKGARVQGGAPAAEKINREQIDNQMIRDTRDLVRYSPDVGIVDNGRHLKGFAMRGVEGNRVGVSIDGVNLPDFQENSLYARYGNFNSSRPSIDPELVRNIDIVKSADSFSYGSGNLGGGVNYRTLSAADVVSGDNPFGGMVKSGYATRNREWVNTVAAAYDGEDLEALALYSQRYGHNFKSKGNGEDIYGDARGIPDPSEHRYHSYLGKLAYRFSPQHRAGVTVSGQQGKNNVEEKSYAVFGWRDAEDTNRRLNANVFYEWTPQESRLSRLKTEFDYAKTSVGALTQNGSFLRDSWFGPITGKEDAYEFKDRNMKSDFKRLTLTADLTPFEAFGSHRLRLKAFGSQSDFKNVNHDTNKYGLDSWYSIQNPTRTKQYGFSLLDNVKWNDTFSGYLGLRYDHTKIKPQDFNLPCPNCTKEPLRDSTFAGWSGTLGLNAKITPTWQAGYHLSSGYRVPT